MKSTLNRITAITLFALGATAMAQASDSDTQTVTANIAGEVSITLGTSPNQIPLTTTTDNDTVQPITVSSTDGFTLYAHTDATLNGPANGKLNEHDGTDYVDPNGKFVDAAHTVTGAAIDGTGTPATVTLPATAATGLIYSFPSAALNKALTATLKVRPPYGTQKLVSPSVYRMVITYTVNVNP